MDFSRFTDRMRQRNGGASATARKVGILRYASKSTTPATSRLNLYRPSIDLDSGFG